VPAPTRGWWRRADVLVAASLLLCLMALVPKGLNGFRAFQNRVACKNNLRALHAALMSYSDRHNGAFPNIADRRYEPHNVAGMVVPILHDDGVLSDPISVTCPANGQRLWSPIALQDLLDMEDEEFARRAPALLGCYAYSLGYYDEKGNVQGIDAQRCPCSSARLPIMADKPPADVGEGGMGNSPNHGGSGQNVLYVDGHCDFQSKRTVGVTDSDDIYLNADHQVAPGMGPGDAVLGSSATRLR
jgi:prepilin-type processing-associated H-X9-DG protein